MTGTGQEDESRTAPFKVVDRRRFTADGEVSSFGRHALEEDRRRPPAEMRPEQAAAPSTPPPATPNQRDASTKAVAQPAPKRQSQVDFMAFVASLASNAMAALGLMAEGQPLQPANPHLAREYIEIIFMLEERTQGNLTADEAASLRQLLSDLRLQYVEATRPASPMG